MKKQRKPKNSLEVNKHYLTYDAQTYDEVGFTSIVGRVRELAQKPRFWSITVKAKTLDPTTGELDIREFNFKPKDRFMLSELAPIVNEHIHAADDFLSDCLSVNVCARVML